MCQRNRLWLKPQVTYKRVIEQPSKDHSGKAVVKTTCDKRNRLWLKPQVTDKRVVGQPGKDHSERSVVKTTGKTPTGFLWARSLLRHWIVVPLASMEVPHHAKFHPVDHIATSLSTGDPEKPVKMTSLSFQSAPGPQPWTDGASHRLGPQPCGTRKVCKVSADQQEPLRAAGHYKRLEQVKIL